MPILQTIKKWNWAERLIILYVLIVLGGTIAVCIRERDVSLLLLTFGLFFPFIPLVILIWSKKWAGIYALLYVLIYALLSFNGKYHDYIGGGGGSPPIFYPLGMENRTPSHKGGRIETEYPNTFGWMFWPFLLVDQIYVHKSQTPQNGALGL